MPSLRGRPIFLGKGGRWFAEVSVHRFVGWTRQERQRLFRDLRVYSPREIAPATDDPAIEQKLEFLEFGGIWIETGNCLWKAGIQSIADIKNTSVQRLTDITTGCRIGPRHFWRRRVVDWHQRPPPTVD